MALQGTDLLVVHRPGPGNGALYKCPVSDFLIDNSYATELQAGIVRLATVEEIIEADNNQLAISPANLATALLSQEYIFDGNSGAGNDDYNSSTAVFNPDSNTTSTPEASETQAGIVRLATAAETEGGTVTDAVITPSGLKLMLDSPTYVIDGGSENQSGDVWDYPTA